MGLHRVTGVAGATHILLPLASAPLGGPSELFGPAMAARDGLARGTRTLKSREVEPTVDIFLGRIREGMIVDNKEARAWRKRLRDVLQGCSELVAGPQCWG